MSNVTTSSRAIARKIVSAFIRPIWLRVWFRIEKRLEPQRQHLNTLQHHVANLDASWHQHVPAFLNAVQSVGAIAREQAAIKSGMEAVTMAGGHVQRDLKDLWGAATRINTEHADIWKRIEFVRSELLYEMRYGANRGVRKSTADEAHTTRIVNIEKLERARISGIKLNLGSGHVSLPDYINVDMRDIPGVDVVAAVDALPFEKGEVSEIFSAHVLEHFPKEELTRKLLPYWFSLLKAGGTFKAVVPDAKAMIRNAADGAYPFEHFREVFFGAQDYDGDFHYNMFTAESLTSTLEAAGFINVRVLAESRKNDIAFELEITATVPNK